MKNDKYYLKARLFPTVITSIPLLCFVTFVINPLYGISLKKVYEVLPFLANTGIYAGFVFLSVQINRFLSKEIFERFFFEEDINMPTTNYLLWNNGFFIIDTKKVIREKIFALFNITLLSAEDEAQDEKRARNLIVHAVSQIKNKLRESGLLYRHNIEYGFVRNFLGGTLIAIIFSLVIIIFSFIKGDSSLRTIGIILFSFYVVPLIFSKLILSRYGKYYAKILYEQFMIV